MLKLSIGSLAQLTIALHAPHAKMSLFSLFFTLESPLIDDRSNALENQL